MKRPVNAYLDDLIRLFHEEYIVSPTDVCLPRGYIDKLREDFSSWPYVLHDPNIKGRGEMEYRGVAIHEAHEPCVKIWRVE